jgi:aryl sulfotransferase
VRSVAGFGYSFNMTRKLPERTREYRNHHLDSLRWNHVPPRPGDIVISTSLKTGTTWTQRIVSLLLFGADPLPDSLWQLSPWIDARLVGPIEEVAALAEAQTHRRFFKSHLPLTALPYDPSVTYIYVGRDARDVAMSMFNHYSAYNELAYSMMASGDDLMSDPLPQCPEDIHVFVHDWLTRGSFAWEEDGYPFWSHFAHARSFWEFRHLPNIHLIHFSDLKADLEGEMRRLAATLGIEVPEGNWPALVEAAGFDAMKRQGRDLLPEMDTAFEGGVDRFFHKGSNGRWHGVLTAEELELFDVAETRAFDDAARRWMRGGRREQDPLAA